MKINDCVFIALFITIIAVVAIRAFVRIYEIKKAVPSRERVTSMALSTVKEIYKDLVETIKGMM